MEFTVYLRDKHLRIYTQMKRWTKRDFFFKGNRLRNLSSKIFLVFHTGQELLHINVVVWWENQNINGEL